MADDAIHYTVTAALRRFSSCDGEEASVSTDEDCEDYPFSDFFRVTLRANGSSGHVSVVFHAESCFKYVFETASFSCTASVLDALGSGRFPQSFSVHYDRLLEEKALIGPEGFGFDRYLRRTTLLDDPRELLPGDCLTLRLEIDVRKTETAAWRNRVNDVHVLQKEDDSWYVRTEADLSRELADISPVFRRMLESPMRERATGRIRIAQEEWGSFSLVSDFLRNSELNATLSGICGLYALADKYDMQRVVRLCRQLLVSGLRAVDTWEKLDRVEESVHRLSELAERFEGDENLSEILKAYSHAREEFESGALPLGGGFADGDLEWMCTHVSRDLFMFVKIERNCSEGIDALTDVFK